MLKIWLARLLYPIFAPQQTKAISVNLQKGRELGKKVNSLLAYRFEDHWQEPINDVRKHLGLPQISPTLHRSEAKAC